MSQVPNMRPIIQKGQPVLRRKAKKDSRSYTASEKLHVGFVKELNCCVCGKSGPSHAHHILAGRVPGRRAPHFLTIPLCDLCHSGKGGIHGDRTLWMIYRKNELEVLAETIELLYGRSAELRVAA